MKHSIGTALLLVLGLGLIGCAVGDYGGEDSTADDDDDQPDRPTPDDDDDDDDGDQDPSCPDDQYEQNDSLPGVFLGQVGSEAVVLTPGLSAQQDEDWFWIHAPDPWNEPFRLYIELADVPANANYELELYRCADEQCATAELVNLSYNPAGEGELIELADVPAQEDGGYYAIRVFSVQGYSCDPYWLYLQGAVSK